MRGELDGFGRRRRKLNTLVARLIAAILTGDGRTPPDVRRAAFAGRADDPEVQRYVELVARHAYRVTEADIGRLRGVGLDDDAIFEITVAAAAGAADTRLRAGLALLGSGA